MGNLVEIILVRGLNYQLRRINNMKKNTIKGVKAWGMFNKNRIVMISLQKPTRKQILYYGELTPVLITPIKVANNKVGK